MKIPSAVLLFVLAGMVDSSPAQSVPSCKELERTGETQKALACYTSLLSVESAPRARANIWTQIAWLHVSAGAHEDALASFREALASSRTAGDRQLEASTIGFIGLVHQFLGQLDVALDYNRRALAIATELGDRKLQGVIYYQLGWISFLNHDYDAALRLYGESLSARRETADANGEGLTLLHLGMTQTSLGNYEKALEYERTALPLLRAHGSGHTEADALDHIGVALTFLHRPEEAITNHERALEIRESIGARWSEAFTLSSLARAQHELGRVADAAASMARLIAMIEAGRRNLSTQRFRASLLSGVWGHYARYIGLLMELHDEATALGASELARARMTLDAVQEGLARSDSSGAGSLFVREKTLREAVEHMQQRNDRGENAAGLDVLKAELRDVESNIAAAFPKLEAARNAEPLTAVQIQSELLDDETALVEYFLGPEKSFVWVVTKTAITSRELPPRTKIESAVVRFRDLLAGGDQRSKRRDLEKAGSDLSSIIVEPLPIAVGIRRLVIVPDGPLFYVPFAALPAHGRLLLDDYEISMAPSASALALLRRSAQARPRSEAEVVVFADPVFRADDPRVTGHPAASAAPDPELTRSVTDTGLRDLQRLTATRAEAETIIRLSRGVTWKALDFEANRDNIMRTNLSRYRLMHLATHALVNTRQPNLSGIVLSLVDKTGRPVNGFVRVHDLYRLNGAPEMVVLSACRTAIGKELRGEGIVGLVNGFMHAGTARIVASYWSVKDRATAELMARFYDGFLRDGLTPAAALRRAQKSMRATAQWNSPSHWAAFALYGVP